MVKNIVFDFDGTIADSAKLMMTIVESLSDKYGYKKFGSNGLKKIRSIGTNKFIFELGIGKENLNMFVNDISISLNEQYDQVNPIENIVGLIKKLQSKNYFLSIVTTNKRGALLDFFKKFNINISPIYDQAGLSGKTKLLQKLVADNHLDKNETVYIGDEERDVLSAKESGLRSIAVTWGLTSKKVLESLNPDFIISRPNELLKILK